MTVENPYRAAGAFAGKAYIRRGADAELVEQIRDNQYYPYFAAPRQSGKSSLIARTMASLDPAEFRCAQVDLSPFVVRSYDDFWRQFLHEVARSANLDPSPIGKGDPRDVFMAWLGALKGRLVVFVDEIDVLLQVECREQIFSKLRTFFNLRAHEPALRRLQFVLAGAAHSSRFISDPRWSPFNVAVEIALEDLSVAQVSQLASYLATAGAFAGPELVGRVYELTGGSVFLCQLVFEALWNRAARGKKKLEPADVDAVIESIVAESPRNIHFYNIFRLVNQDARLAMLFRRMVDGEELGEEDRKELQLTGICRGMNPFRNEVYARVFGAGGPLDLKVAGAKVALGRKLEAALVRRQQLQDAGQVTADVDAEIVALKREFREGAKLREGDVLGRGRYKLVRRIGQGGFATVWQARDEQAQRDVALKVLHGQFAEDKTRRDRFFRGAWKMSELRHPAIAQVYEPYGEEGGRYFFVMEYLAGGTLHENVLDKKLTPDQVVATIVAVGKALAHAHERGLVHRDVKPSNVLLASDGSARLTDFDLVREQDAQGATVTGPMGSFIYSAPEVMNRPQDADHRADVYGLAMTAVFGLYGADLPLDVVRDADRFVDRLRVGGLAKDVLKKGVAWEIERRFRSAAEFSTALATAWSEPDIGEIEEEDDAAAVVVPLERSRAGAAVAGAAVAGAAVASVAVASAATAVAAAPAGKAVAAAPAAGLAAPAAPAAGPAAPAAPSPGLAAPAAAAAGSVAAGAAEAAVAPAPQDRSGAPPPAQAVGEGASPAKVRPGWPLAALGLLASAALVLLTIKVVGPGGSAPAGDTLAMSDKGRSESLQVVPKAQPAGDKKVVGETGGRSDPAPTKGALPDRPEIASATAGVPPENAITAGDAATDDAAGDTGDEAEATTGAATKVETKRVGPSSAEQIDDGCAQVKVGDAERGVQVLRRVREDRPHDIKLLTCLADGLYKIGEFRAAESYYLQLIADYPRNKIGYLGVAKANEMLNRGDRAALYYEQVLAIDPGNRTARNFLAGMGQELPPDKPAPLR